MERFKRTRCYYYSMEELELSQELYVDMVNWMRNKYSVTTIKNRSALLKKISKEHRVMNHDTLKKIMNNVKYQYQRATLVMINTYCYDANIEFSIRIPSIKAQAKKLPDILSPEEIKLMINAAPKPYDLVIRCIFNMGAGLRVSEVIKMSWGHIRWADWLGDKENYGVINIKSGKGSKDRIINIPKNLMKDIYEYAKENNLLNEYGIPTGGMIFTFGCSHKKQLEHKDMEVWKAEYVQSSYDWFRYNILKNCCEKALNKHIKIHQLRHSRSTYLYEIEKVPIEKIQILLGHASMNTTMLYTRINPISVFNKLKETKEI